MRTKIWKVSFFWPGNLVVPGFSFGACIFLPVLFTQPAEAALANLFIGRESRKQQVDREVPQLQSVPSPTSKILLVDQSCIEGNDSGVMLVSIMHTPLRKLLEAICLIQPRPSSYSMWEDTLYLCGETMLDEEYSL